LRSIILILWAALSTAFFISCGDNAVEPVVNEQVLFEKQGLVDSAVVTGCYAFTVRYLVPDTLELGDYSKIKIEFDGYTTSDYSTILVLYHTDDTSNVIAYEVSNMELNGFHSFETAKPSGRAWFELWLYLNPQVCGQGDFKYTRARDLIIYGIR